MTEFKFSTQTENLTDAYVRIMYNDSSMVEPLSKNYNGLKRDDMKSATIISKDGKPLYTLPIKNNKLIYRKRNLALQDNSISFENPKRCIILATEGKIVFFWDSEEIVEFKEWQKNEPYTKPELRDDEK